nr:MAG TPA: tail fiber assembly protein [Caudoviricetes sp.]
MTQNIQWTKPVCQLDTNHLYIGQTTADLDIMARDGSYLIPAGCIDTDPPQISAGKAARWNGEGWDFIEDHRGKTAYRTADGAAVQIEQVGELPDELTFTPREKEHQTWDAKAKAWVLLPAVAAQIKAEQQDEMWGRIKQKRYDSLRHGVYAESVGKWFQTDDATRVQYLALALESVTGGFKKPINWKTMDNSFLQLTLELLREIMQAMHDNEQANFANAERHKAAMLQAEHPLEYDYSDGWTTNFDEQPAAELEEADK